MTQKVEFYIGMDVELHYIGEYSGAKCLIFTFKRLTITD